MAEKLSIKDRIVKVIYDEWFKILIGGAILAVFSFFLPTIFGKNSNRNPAVPVADGGISLEQTYIVAAEKSYPIVSSEIPENTVVSLRWVDSKLTTRDQETNDIVVIDRESVGGTMSLNSGRSFNGPISQGRPFTAGNCDTGGVIMHLMEPPVREDANFKVRFVPLTCSSN